MSSDVRLLLGLGALLVAHLVVLVALWRLWSARIIDRLTQVERTSASTVAMIEALVAARAYSEPRLEVVLRRAQQAPPGVVMLLGDSVFEGLLLTLDGHRVFDAGIGSGRIEHGHRVLERWPEDARPALIVILLGVNDAARPLIDERLPAEWSARYGELLDVARRVSDGRVLAATIPPVERSGDLGTLYFDGELVRSFNRSIRQLAHERGIALVDLEARFDVLRGEGRVYTHDGVHPNALGYRVLRDELEGAIDGAIRARQPS